jgi:hypothetical protein
MVPVGQRNEQAGATVAAAFPVQASERLAACNYQADRVKTLCRNGNKQYRYRAWRQPRIIRAYMASEAIESSLVSRRT